MMTTVWQIAKRPIWPTAPCDTLRRHATMKAYDHVRLRAIRSYDEMTQEQRETSVWTGMTTRRSERQRKRGETRSDGARRWRTSIASVWNSRV